MTKRFARLAAVGTIGLCLAAGCRNEQQEAEPGTSTSRELDAFPIVDHRPAVARIMNAQAIVGARKDATLRAADFKGTQLSSLGRQKLEMMLHREPGDRPQMIYIDLPEADTLSGERRRTVRRYIEEAGLDPQSVEIHAGPNVGNSHPAAPSLARLRKTETMQGEGGPGAIGPGAGTTITGGDGGTAGGFPR